MLKFPRLLDKHDSESVLFAQAAEVAQACGLKVGTGIIVDATVAGAPSSRKYIRGE